MAPIKIPYQHVTGCFEHKETRARFEYITHAGDASAHGWNESLGAQYPHLVCVNSVGDPGLRYAIVKKTVAYIVVDEDDEGHPVVEKWPVKHDWMRAAEQVVRI